MFKEIKNQKLKYLLSMFVKYRLINYDSQESYEVPFY